MKIYQIEDETTNNYSPSLNLLFIFSSRKERGSVHSPVFENYDWIICPSSILKWSEQ